MVMWPGFWVLIFICNILTWIKKEFSLLEQLIWWWMLLYIVIVTFQVKIMRELHFFYRSFRQVHSKWLQWHASALLPPKCPLQGLCPSEWVGHKNAYFWLEFAHYTRSNQKKKNWFMLFIGIYHVEFRMPQINNNQPKGSPPKPTNRNTHSHFNFNVTSFSIISVAEVEALRAIHPVRVPLNW